MKKILMMICIISMLFISPNIVKATSTKNIIPGFEQYYKMDEYIINNYDVNIKVNENNTFDITETIDTTFIADKHGLFRKIPFTNNVKRLDGTSSTNFAKISNIKVNEEYTTSFQPGNKVIKIGDPNSILKGDKHYVISYTYDIGEDPLKGKDELYFNIIGNEWDTTIKKVTFTITMPSDFDESSLGFSVGFRGTANNEDIIYTVKDKTIEGYLDKELGSLEALTVRLELPEDYFNGESRLLEQSRQISIILPFVFIVIALLLWSVYGKDDIVVETVEFYPPDGLNSLEVSKIFNTEIESHDITSLLIYLANKGYLKIDETIYEKDGYKFTKLKEYDGNNEIEKMFFEGLFSYNSGFKKNIPTNVVTIEGLKNRFYVTMNKIKSKMKKKEIVGEYFEKNSLNKSFFIFLMNLTIFLLITVPPLILFSDYIWFSIFFLGILFPIIGWYALFMIILSRDNTVMVGGKATNSKIGKMIFTAFFGFVFIGTHFQAFILPYLMVNPMYLLIYIFGIICVMVLLFINKIMPKRTPYGNELYGRIKGFKTFLVVAEKDRLEALVKDNPSYFYDILPYTYVLGVSDTWISKFESISIQSPTWYGNGSGFSVASFGNSLNSAMSSAGSAMSSSPSSSRGGSGGGFSGGGSGGGGGGSW